jgi:hypothetical protein
MQNHAEVGIYEDITRFAVHGKIGARSIGSGLRLATASSVDISAHAGIYLSARNPLFQTATMLRVS